MELKKAFVSSDNISSPLILIISDKTDKGNIILNSSHYYFLDYKQY